MLQSNQPQLSLSKKRAGVLVPLFSVYSRNSFGIADLNDLKLVIDWTFATGNSIIQLLPMNEMDGVFCPYDSMSSFALEPVYISLLDLPIPKDKSLKRQIDNLRKNLPDNKRDVISELKKEKLRLAREIFLMNQVGGSRDFNDFRSQNQYWLEDFSLFKALKANFSNSVWYDWPDEFKNRNQGVLEEFRNQHAQEIIFQEWLQWQLYIQFKQVKEYAAKRKVFLNGDLPIFISRDSSDVWSHPEFFKLEFAAGAPPDMYCAKGQRWGMPTYNWVNIASGSYRYLKEKLKYAGNFYDILRIDHVVGLFRIWSIPYNEPLENKGLNGFFDPADESEWERHGSKILEVMLSSTNMFLCAEDLGVIPKVCTDTLKRLKIPGNDVERWVKDWEVKHDFLKPQDYREFSVAMLSTHDTTNWPAWWENEAGTVDEDLFRRKCIEAGIDFTSVKEALFDLTRSLHGRLRWKEDIDSVDKLVKGLSPTCPPKHQWREGTVPKDSLYVLIGLYEDTYGEKDKLWKHLGLAGPMREKCDREIFQAILKMNLQASSLFCINTIVDLLYLDDVWKGDAYQYRINTPGTVGNHNWSLKIPLYLEDLMKHPASKKIRKLIASSGRDTQ